MRSFLFNPHGQLRSGWRAAIFLITYLFISAFFILASISVMSNLEMGESARSFLPLTLPFAVSAAVAVGLGLLFGRYLEGVRASAFGISISKQAAVDFLIGCLVGACAIATAVVVAWAAGGVTLERNTVASSSEISATLGYTLAIFLVGALSEEVLFRGYLLQTFIRDGTAAVGIILTSVLFALAHNQNPGFSRLSFLNTLIAGFWFAAAYLKTRNIWFPLGIHLMWNWLQGPVFGINVSGISDLSPHPLLRTSDRGPEWLTGGAYGIEGGLVCTAAIIVFTLILYLVPYWGNKRDAVKETNS